MRKVIKLTAKIHSWVFDNQSRFSHVKLKRTASTFYCTWLYMYK